MGKRIRKEEVITFKADATLLEAMKGVENRSHFIRTAVLAALESACPLCKGTGVLNPRQREHWMEFAAGHAVEECDECHELMIVCGRERGAQGARGALPRCEGQ